MFHVVGLDKRYVMLSSGELLIRLAKPADSAHSFKCTLHNVLTGQSTVSQNGGKIIVTGELVLCKVYIHCSWAQWFRIADTDLSIWLLMFYRRLIWYERFHMFLIVLRILLQAKSTYFCFVPSGEDLIFRRGLVQSLRYLFLLHWNDMIRPPFAGSWLCKS